MATILGSMAPHKKAVGELSRQEHTRRNWIGVPLARDIPLTLRSKLGGLQVGSFRIRIPGTLQVSSDMASWEIPVIRALIGIERREKL